jgi:hypothetical protein
VAKDRGVAWIRPVTPEVLPDQQFLAALHASGGGVPGPARYQDPNARGATYAALGLVSSPEAYDDITGGHESLDTDVSGFYDDENERLVVRGTEWDDDLAITVVHELAHALADQHFDLGHLDASARVDDESDDALAALIEGDATRVEDDYAATLGLDSTPLGPAQQDATDDEAWAQALTALPYDRGLAFVKALVAAGGNAAVDAAFRSPPRTSAQLEHPSDWRSTDRSGASAPPFPEPGTQQVLDRGRLGVLLLAQAVAGPRTLDLPVSAFDAWRGDSYLTTSDAGRLCFVDDAVFADTSGRDRAVAAVRPWADSHQIVLVLTSPTTFRLHRCR